MLCKWRWDFESIPGPGWHLLKVKWIWHGSEVDTAGTSTLHICCATTLVLHQSYDGSVPNYFLLNSGVDTDQCAPAKRRCPADHNRQGCGQQHWEVGREHVARNGSLSKRNFEVPALETGQTCHFHLRKRYEVC